MDDNEEIGFGFFGIVDLEKVHHIEVRQPLGSWMSLPHRTYIIPKNVLSWHKQHKKGQRNASMEGEYQMVEDKKKGGERKKLVYEDKDKGLYVISLQSMELQRHSTIN